MSCKGLQVGRYKDRLVVAMMFQIPDSFREQRSIARSAALSALVTALLVGCGDEGAEINGENSVIVDSSLPVTGANGEDLTAINQDNFPIMYAPVEPEVMAEPEPAAALPLEVTPNDLVNGELTLDWADFIGVNMASTFASIASTVLAEYELGSGNQIFLDDTVEISKRIANKTGCGTGALNSDLTFNGNAISAGTLTYVACETTDATLYGEIVFTTVPADDDDMADAISMNLVNLFVESDTFYPEYNGTLTLMFIGDEIELRTDEVSVVYDGVEAVEVQTDAGNQTVNELVVVEEVWSEVELTGRLSDGGERRLSGTARMSNPVSTYSVLVELDNVVVAAGDTIPSGGKQTLTHTDNSRLNFDYDQSTDEVLMYTRTSPARVTTSESMLWADVLTRVPLP